MSVRNGIVLLFALSTLSLLIGCGNNNNIAPIPPPSGSFSNSNLTGTYVFSVSGTDANGATVVLVGSFAANGGGKITGGTIDMNDADFSLQTTPIAPISAAAISGGSTYNVSVDGRGQAVLGTTTPFGTITLDFVLSSSSHGLITEFDENASGSGTLDLQTSGLTQGSLTGPYAFSFSGINSGLNAPLTTVGAFTLDANGIISAGGEDFNNGDIASPYSNQSLTGQVILGPASPALTTLTTPSFETLTFDVYAIDSTHLKFIEMDTSPILVGDAYSQPSATISASTNAFTLSGFLPFSASSAVPLAAGGIVTTDGGGGIAGTEDYNSGGNTSTNPISFSANYSNAGSVTPSRFVLSNFSSFVGGTEYAAYPSSGGLLLMEIDNSGITSGAAYTQSTTAFGTASEGYGLNLTGLNILGTVTGGEEEVDDIAEFTADATGSCDSFGDTLCGIIDENFAPLSGGLQPIAGMALGGSYGNIDTTGRYGLSAAAGNSNISTLNGGFNLNFYTVDGTTFPFVELDQGQIATGVFVLQNPAAATPATAHSHMFIARPLINPHAARAKKK
jgi:hypothetical protein